MSVSDKLFERAKKVMPGGVNSPVRAFKSVGGSPRFITKAKGDRISDVDGNRYGITDVSALDRASYRRIELYL